ncbi:hypothetical protein GCM10010260_37120 [Streptomyces filipinensis]|uniref:Regulatory protein n=1 Tax=Streptomyces filipinensis TaxID=66887 RepID=A0A918MC90_9ACTN|nr:hypothetical protein [Streptomyces filipinensis]GGU97743.1 hypothetical protein GCM10010260_37120 [Streptomyces filipinensis]
MPEPTTPVTELTSQYVSQVTNDLEHNVKEQERITAEIVALQEQLTALQHDHTVLTSMQQALGVTSVGAPATTDSAVVPGPRTKTTATAGTRRTPKKAATEQSEPRKRSAKKPVAAKPTAKKAAAPTAQPTLVELVRRHLADQQEPRSAAEVAEALEKAHPDRAIQTKVIRTTLENLVARNNAQRTKQGSSVFYTLPAGSEPAAASAEEPQPEAAE